MIPNKTKTNKLKKKKQTNPNYKLKKDSEPVMVAPTLNPSTRETETEAGDL